MGLIGFKRHNHDECIAQAVRAVDEQCVRDKLQLTPVRRKVLEILLFQHRALGAYDILEHPTRTDLILIAGTSGLESVNFALLSAEKRPVHGLDSKCPRGRNYS